MNPRIDVPVHALRFQNGDSVIHRLPPVAKILLAGALATLAILAREPTSLVALLGAVTLGYALARLSYRDLWRDVRWLLLQGAIVWGLTLWLQPEASAWSGGRTALQLLLVFLPMALVVRTTSSERLLVALDQWLPERLAFAIGATLRFLPFFARELGELVEVQRHRGARLALRDLWRPVAWRDWLACVAVPMTLRTIEVANEAADAASLRGFAARDSNETRPTGEPR